MLLMPLSHSCKCKQMLSRIHFFKNVNLIVCSFAENNVTNIYIDCSAVYRSLPGSSENLYNNNNACPRMRFYYYSLIETYFTTHYAGSDKSVSCLCDFIKLNVFR